MEITQVWHHRLGYMMRSIWQSGHMIWVLFRCFVEVNRCWIRIYLCFVVTEMQLLYLQGFSLFFFTKWSVRWCWAKCRYHIVLWCHIQHWYTNIWYQYCHGRWSCVCIKRNIQYVLECLDCRSTWCTTKILTHPLKHYWRLTFTCFSYINILYS